MALKGQKFKQWSAEEKFKIIEPIIKFEKSSTQVTKETGINNGLITQWVHKFRKQKEKEAFDICLQKIEKHNLDMKLIRKVYDLLGKHYDTMKRDKKL